MSRNAGYSYLEVVLQQRMLLHIVLQKSGHFINCGRRKTWSVGYFWILVEMLNDVYILKQNQIFL